MMMSYLYSSAYGYNVASMAASTAMTEAERVLRDSLHRYAVANEALWQLLSVKLGISEDELRQTIEAVEKQHTEQHGPPICPNCPRPAIGHLQKCCYCSVDLGAAKPVFG